MITLFFSIQAIGQPSTDSTMRKVRGKIFYQGEVFPPFAVGVMFDDNEYAKQYHSDYMQLRSSANANTVVGIIIGGLTISSEIWYRIERKKNEELGILGALNAKFFTVWKMFSTATALTSAALLVTSISKKEKANRALDRSIRAFNLELLYGRDDKINLDVRLTSDGVGLLYTF